MLHKFFSPHSSHTSSTIVHEHIAFAVMKMPSAFREEVGEDVRFGQFFKKASREIFPPSQFKVAHLQLSIAGIVATCVVKI